MVHDAQHRNRVTTFGHDRKSFEDIHVLDSRPLTMRNDLPPVTRCGFLEGSFHQPEIDRVIVGQYQQTIALMTDPVFVTLASRLDEGRLPVG